VTGSAPSPASGPLPSSSSPRRRGCEFVFPLLAGNFCRKFTLCCFRFGDLTEYCTRGNKRCEIYL
jgi:hypothetical protein